MERWHSISDPVLYILYLYSLKTFIETIAFEAEWNRQAAKETLDKAFAMLYDIRFSAMYEEMGNSRDEFEVDEIHVVSRRDGRGRILSGERYWLIGCFNRTSGSISLKVVRNRNAAICEQFCREDIPMGARILTYK